MKASKNRMRARDVDCILGSVAMAVSGVELCGKLVRMHAAGMANAEDKPLKQADLAAAGDVLAVLSDYMTRHLERLSEGAGEDSIYLADHTIFDDKSD